MLSILFHPNTETFGALGGLACPERFWFGGGLSYSWKLDFRQPARSLKQDYPAQLQVLDILSTINHQPHRDLSSAPMVPVLLER